MPRAVARAFTPFYKVLRDIATNSEEPTPLRLRSCEMCLALRTGEWSFATGNRTASKAIRRITAADSVDAELLRLSGILDELKKQTERMADSLETPEQRREKAIDDLLAKAAQEKEQNESENRSIETDSE